MRNEEKISTIIILVYFKAKTLAYTHFNFKIALFG